MQRQRLGVIGVRFDVLGPLRLAPVSGDDEPKPVSGARRRNLLAMLLVHANRPVPAATLADALWGNAAGDAATRLHVQVYRLRATLDDPDRLLSDASGYRLRVDHDESDAQRFEALVEEASDQSPGQAVETLREALALWRGDAYSGIDLPAVTAETHRLGERRLDALEALYAAELDHGRHAMVTAELDEVAQRYPFRERLHVLLMTALHRSGRRADALAAYQHARRVFVDELGLEPGAELHAVEQAVLDGTLPEHGGPGGAPAAPVAPVGVPAQLPQRPGGFVGRAAPLSALDGMLRATAPVGVMAVVGGGGVGKTSLVLSWAHAARDRFPDGHLYADLRGYGPDRPAAPEEVLAAFLRALGVDGSSIPEDPGERAARFRTLTAGRQMLIVLDNARSSEQVRPLLPGLDSCRVAVTSRDSLAGLVAREGAHRIHLERLTEHESTRLLTSLLGGAESAAPGVFAALGELAARCDGLPLALRIAAERLREGSAGPTEARIVDLVSELTDAHSRLDVLDAGDGYTSVRSMFAASYDHLPPEAARLLRLFGIHPGRDIDDAALAALAGTDRRTTRRSVDVLVRAHLVEDCDGRYSLHDLLWTYATDLAESIDPPEERRAAWGRLLDHYLSTASRATSVIFPDEVDPAAVTSGELEPGGGEDPLDFSGASAMDAYDVGTRWLDAERANLLRGMDVADEAGRPAYTTDLSRILAFYVDVRGYLDDGFAVHTRAVEIARERGDTVAEGTSLRGHGLLAFRANRFDECQRVTERALELHLGAGAVLPTATTYNCLGVLYGLTGLDDEALHALRRTIALYRTDERFLTMACRPLVGLGLQLRRSGEHKAAHQALSEAFELAVEGGLAITQGHASYGLATVLVDAGRDVEALDVGLRAVSLARRTRFRFLEALSLYRIGTIHLRRRELDEALQRHGEALCVARSMDNVQLQAMTLNGTADTETAAGRPRRAAEAHRSALAAAAGGGADFENARAHCGLGDVLERLGERDRAVEHWRLALDHFRSVGAKQAAHCEAKLAQ